MRVFDFNSAIVRTPANSVVAGLRAAGGPPPSYPAVRAEHQAYVAALRLAGIHVTVLDALEPYPDSIFVEDPALVFSDAAILLRPGAPSRLGEATELARELEQHFARLLRLEGGYADGGDILVTPDAVLIGLSKRTDPAGAAALQRLLWKIGHDARIAHTPKGTLHLKTASSLIDEETILAAPALASAECFADYCVITAPEAGGANVLRVNDVVFVGSEFRRTQDLLSQRGLNVVPLPITEIGKIDAGLTCMSLRWFDPNRRAA